MVHNGIGYTILESIAEAYDIMKNSMKLEINHIKDIFREWFRSELDSYLLKITVNVLERADPNVGPPLIELMSDKAKQKGTGKWALQRAVDLGVPTPSIDAAVTLDNIHL